MLYVSISEYKEYKEEVRKDDIRYALKCSQRSTRIGMMRGQGIYQAKYVYCDDRTEEQREDSKFTTISI